MIPQPLVSIIVPIYNSQTYLAECIESLLGQSLKDIEILLINDGSTDASGAICDRFACQDARIRVIHQSNQGVSAARSTGVEVSKSNWIIFVDADDVCYPHMAAFLLETALRNQCDIVKAGIINTKGRKYIHSKTGIFHQKEYIKSLLNDQTLGFIYASIYIKSIFPKGGLQIPADFKIGEDILSCMTLAKHAEKIMTVPNVVYHYRTNEESVMCQKITHPFYWNKFYAYINQVIGSEYTTQASEKIRITRKIKSFLEPEVTFDKEVAKDIRLDLKNHPELKGELKYAVFFPSNLTIRLLKSFKRIHIQLKSRHKNGKKSARQIIR